MKKYFHSELTFTSSTWALLAITRFFLAFIVMISYGHIDKFTALSDFLFIAREFGGKAAVIVFLMISGISVSYSIIKSKEGFFKRRFLRIYPLYFIAVLVTVFLQNYLGSPYFAKDANFVAAGYLTSISNLLLLQGIVSLPITYNNPLWSISIEFFLYIILPLIYTLRLRYVYFLALLSVLLYVTHTHFFVISLYGVQHIMYAWPFIVGLLIAVKKQFWGVLLLILIGTLGIYYNFLKEAIIEKFAFLWFLVTTTIIICFLYLKINLSRQTKVWFNYLGMLSYPMYLFHFPFYFILYHIGIRDAYLFIGLSILFCIPVNYIFDVWLKKIVWKPLVETMETFRNRFSFTLSENLAKKL